MISRRNALTAIAALTGSAAISSEKVRAKESAMSDIIPAAIPLKLGARVPLAASSSPVRVNAVDMHLLTVSAAVFTLDAASRLTAVLKAAVTEYAKMDYWVSVAVFDATGHLLGAVTQKETVEYERLRAIPTMLREIKLDFGISNAFSRAALVAIAISERDVPHPA
jgi:hypothetical protein